MSNSLRGGKKSFSVKTLLGNFVEDGGPEGRDVSSLKFTTVARLANYDYGAKPGRFGASLDAVKIDRSNPLGGTYTSPDFYKTVTSSVHCDPTSGLHTNDFTTDFKLVGGPKSQEEVLKYRSEWTNEDDANKLRRFRTTNNGVQLSKYGGVKRE